MSRLLPAVFGALLACIVLLPDALLLATVAVGVG